MRMVVAIRISRIASVIKKGTNCEHTAGGWSIWYVLQPAKGDSNPFGGNQNAVPMPTITERAMTDNVKNINRNGSTRGAHMAKMLITIPSNLSSSNVLGGKETSGGCSSEFSKFG
jgi:hypothetical protein